MREDENYYSDIEPTTSGEYKEDSSECRDTANEYKEYSNGYSQYDTQYNTQYNNSYDTYNPYNMNQEQPGQALGIASMILGIASLVLFCSCLNIPMAIVAIVLGVIQLTKAGSSKGMAITGIVTSALSLIFMVIFVGLFMLTANVAESSLNDTLEIYEDYETLQDFDLDLDETF